MSRHAFIYQKNVRPRRCLICNQPAAKHPSSRDIARERAGDGIDQEALKHRTDLT